MMHGPLNIRSDTHFVQYTAVSAVY